MLHLFKLQSLLSYAIVCHFVLLSSSFEISRVPSHASIRRHSMKQPAMMMSEAASLVSDLGASYSYCLDHYFFPTQSATGGVFTAVGDGIAQATTKRKNENYDPQRTFNYFLKGLGGGILWACWFQIADSWSSQLTQEFLYKSLGLDETNPNAERITRTSISILLEQFLVCPLFYTFWDIPIPALLRGSPIRQIPAQVQTKLGRLLVENAKVWTPVNLVTYNIPVEFRVLFTSCADILWQSINARITSQEIQVPLTAPIAGSVKIVGSNATEVVRTTVEETA